jgi:SAM domain (Sterile alpha motif)/Adenylate and Guanylate cyclase catalytic domain
MSEVREWLEAIGLVQYADAFEANDIDIDLLGQVDDQMLKDIGVSSAGHRLRIRNAIAKLSPASPLAKNEKATSAATEPKTQNTAERRQVTVMFSDLVGSTALSARMDPEDLLEVISAYQKCVAQVVERFGGFVAKLSAGPRGRRREGSPGGAGVDPSSGWAEDRFSTANPRGDCHRVGRGR